jgi:hypothetical protein
MQAKYLSSWRKWLGRSRCKWEDNIQMCLKEIVLGGRV